MLDRYVFRRMFAAAALGLVMTMLASCGAPQGPYHAYDPPKFFSGGGTGYSETPVRPDVYQIGYTGSDSPTQSRYYATIRAAELALQFDKPYFEIIQAFPGESPVTWALYNNPATQPALQEMAKGTIVIDEHTASLDNSTSSILVHFYQAPTPRSLDAKSLLTQAMRKEITLSPATLAKLNQPATTTGSH